MEKIDPYKSKERLERWKSSTINTISKTNLQYLKSYISDMEKGINVSGTVKGARSPIKLLSLASRIKKIMELSESKFKSKDITLINSEQIHELFLDMHSGKIKKETGSPYIDVGDYIKRFKSFWHWHIKVKRKENKIVQDITLELSVERKRKPPFVYFTKEELDKMLDKSDYDTKATMAFLFDSGIRAPTELQNIRACDFVNDFKEVNIREETTKNKYGRRIHLKICSEIMRKFIIDNHLTGEDLVFTINPATLNKRLRIIGKKVLGDKITLGREKGSKLSMYDFRHSSGCFWLIRYKSEMSLMYRFAWKNREMIDYYTELLGLKDLISDEDMMTGTDKTLLEKEIIQLRSELRQLQSRSMEFTKQVLDHSQKQDATIEQMKEVLKLFRKVNNKLLPNAK